MKRNSIGYLSFLMVWIILSCLIPNILLSITENLSVMQRITNIVLPAGVYWLLMSISRNVGRSGLWMFIFSFFAGFQIVLLYIYGRSVIAVDMLLNMVTTNVGEATELLDAMLPILIVVFVVYLTPLVMSVIACIRKFRLPAKTVRRNRLYSLIVICLGLICYMASFFSSRPFRPLNDIYPLNVGYNLYLAVKRTYLTRNYHKTSESYKFNAVSTHPSELSELYVLVIGETSRADSWQLTGYDRRNNIRLAADTGLVAFPKAFSQSNTTHKSVPMLMSPIDATTFNDSIYSTKGILAAFKEAGFSTAYISNQRRNHSFIDFMGEQADTVIFLKDNLSVSDDRTAYDEALLAPLTSILAGKPKKQLIVLHTYGSHFNYNDRYPEETAMYLPDSPVKVDRDCRECLVNAYDNSVAYTADVLADIIEVMKKRPGISAMLYTSDHGEDLFDDDRNLFLHASPVPSYYQVHVPLLAWVSEGYGDALPGRVKALKTNSDKQVATSASFFHTAMDLAGISWPGRKGWQSVASDRYKPSTLLYLTDHNEGVDLKDSGITDHDFDKFDAAGISL